jgi:hypothetical protein
MSSTQQLTQTDYYSPVKFVHDLSAGLIRGGRRKTMVTVLDPVPMDRAGQHQAANEQLATIGIIGSLNNPTGLLQTSEVTETVPVRISVHKEIAQHQAAGRSTFI